MGICRDKMHKRRASGAMTHHWHKKQKYAMGRQPANTKLIIKSNKVGKAETAKIRDVRCRGCMIKQRALRLSTGNFSWGSMNMTRKARITSVVYNATSNDLVRTNTLVKGAVVAIEANSFKENKSKDEAITKQIEAGRLLARISSRPGQVGRADGYILEGPELAFYQKKLASK